MGSFSDSIAENIDKIFAEIDANCYSICWRLFTNIVQITPSPSYPGVHAKGLLANQWYPMADGISSSVSTNISATGSDSLSRIGNLSGSKTFYAKDGMMSLANNLSYADKAERTGWTKADGFSGRVGPYRMVALSLLEIKDK